MSKPTTDEEWDDMSRSYMVYRSDAFVVRADGCGGLEICREGSGEPTENDAQFMQGDDAYAFESELERIACNVESDAKLYEFSDCVCSQYLPD